MAGAALSVAPDDTAVTPAEAPGYEAMRLFADRAAAALPSFAIGPANAGAVASLCRALDGIPLAIELAAARVRALSIEQISARLTDRFGLLTGGDRTAPARQRTLRGTIDWSHDCCPARSRSCCAGCRFRGGRWRWPNRCAPMTSSRPGTSSAGRAGGQVAGGARAGGARPGALPAAAHDPRVRGRTPGGSRRSAAFQRRLCATRCGRRSGTRPSMARVPAPWPSRVRVPPVRRGRRQRVAGAGLVPGHLRRRSGPADLHRGQPVLDPPRRVRRRRRAAGLLPGAGCAVAPRPHPGAALVARAQPTLSSDPAAAGSGAEAGLAVAGRPGGVGTAAALNRPAEAALHRGRMADAASRVDQGLAAAQGVVRRARGVRPGHPGRGGGPAGPGASAAAGQRLDDRDAPHRSAVGGGPHPARPRGPGPAARRSGRGARPLPGGDGHPA